MGIGVTNVDLNAHKHRKRAEALQALIVRAVVAPAWNLDFPSQATRLRYPDTAPKTVRTEGLLTPSSEHPMPLKTLLIDNYDSYTYNLFQLIAEVNGGVLNMAK
jgi:hypothetical protein